jgi:hypothetical protein
MNLLSECDEDAEVRIMSQEGWPLENGIKGIALREDMAGDDVCECDHRFTEPHEDGSPATEEMEYADGLKANDVFIVEGDQQRYGDESGWEVVRRWWPNRLRVQEGRAQWRAALPACPMPGAARCLSVVRGILLP